MNKSEREKLARIAAECQYGEGADHASSLVGLRIREAFPAIEEVFANFADVEAAYRVAGLIISGLAGGGSRRTDDEKFSALINVRAGIAEAIDMWCVDNGRRASTMVDKGQDIALLLSDASLKAFILAESKHNESLRIFAKLL